MWSLPPDPAAVYSVYSLTSLIRTVLEDTCPDVWVRGEISNFTAASSGHFYFTLKDSRAQVRAVCFRGSQRNILCQPRNGMEVLARGRISVYEPRGEYQLIVQEMVDQGHGRLQLAFEQLKEKLKKEGLFDTSRKRPLPLLPARVGVVTSPTGAAIRDIIQVLQRRNSSVHVLVYPVKVQGEGSAGEIAAGIRYFSECPEIDVVIAGRGGGSLEDLWSFNEEEVARAAFTCRVPVISAVGHEIDFTILDFAADLRAPTPSAAAELVAAAAEELQNRLEFLGRSLLTAWDTSQLQRSHRLEVVRLSRGFSDIRHRLLSSFQKLDESRLRLEFAGRRMLAGNAHRLENLDHRCRGQHPARLLQDLEERFRLLRQRLAAGFPRSLAETCQRLRHCREKIASLDPRAVLRRGYAICLGPEGSPLIRAGQAAPGDAVAVLLHQGRLDCRVEAIRLNETEEETR